MVLSVKDHDLCPGIGSHLVESVFVEFVSFFQQFD